MLMSTSQLKIYLKNYYNYHNNTIANIVTRIVSLKWKFLHNLRMSYVMDNVLLCLYKFLSV